jgi:superfamily II DNA or RNA helicase
MTTERTFAQKAKIVILDEVNCVIAGLHPEHLTYFWEEYGIKTDHYFFTLAYKVGKWDGKMRFFSDTGKTYNFLLDEILPKIEALGYKLEVDDRRNGQLADVPTIDANHFSYIINPKTGEPWIMRPYQVDATNTLIAEGMGIAIAGTGSGKTLMNACICDSYAKQGLRTITIVPSGSLIIRTKRDFDMMKLDVGEYSGKTKDLNHTHVISTWQALQNAPHILKDFQVLVVDECHGAKATVLKDLLTNHGNNVVYRFGLTATMPTGKADRMAISLTLGQVLYVIPAHELIEQGWLAKLNISVMQLDDSAIIEPSLVEGFKTDYSLEMDYLNKLERRLNWVAEFLKEKAENKKGNVLCLVNNIATGKKLAKRIPEAVFIYGKDEDEEREEVYRLFETNDNLLVIATVHIAGVGIDIDRIFNLIYIDGGKSFIRTIQSIGRGLRKGRDKDYVDVVDICGNLEYSKKHLRKRLKYYKEAQYPCKKYSVQY